MNLLELIFWLSFFFIFYTFIGYPLLMYFLFRFESIRYFIRIPEDAGKVFINPELGGKIIFDQRFSAKEFTPFVSMIIAAYNEEKFIEEKIKNCLELNYPSEKIEFLFVTDGSNDKTPEIVQKYSETYPNVKLFHQSERQGKLKAINRVVPYAKGEILVFSDANSFYNKDAISFLVRHFQFEKIGCVAGEKRVISKDGKLEAEGLYWKYESFLKKLDSEIFSIVGAAGEIFAIRKDLFLELPENTINEDFVITMNIAAKGYRVVYEPKAYAVEEPTKSIFEEFKRRIRISTGGLQAIFLLKNLFDIRKYKFLTFQFISHRILRWTITPLSLLLIYISNLLIFLKSDLIFYKITFYFQTVFYCSALIGFLAELVKIKINFFYLIFSFILMNFVSVIALITYPFRARTNIWQKVER
ncbi:MAG: glycosyltransferase family 2 protein [Ignavibacteria bacterium]|nr:glycosyltransferase family 2 protein [Ignavibacteria bacterium]